MNDHEQTVLQKEEVMSDDGLQVYLNLTSVNEEVRNQASSFMNRFMEEPKNLFILYEHLKTSLSMTKVFDVIPYTISLAILHMIRDSWPEKFEQEYIEPLYNGLFDFLFSSPYNLHNNFLECFSQIFKIDSCKERIFIGLNERIMLYFDEKASFDIHVTALCLFAKWLYYYKSYLNKIDRNKIDNITLSFLPELYRLCQISSKEIKKGENMVQFIDVFSYSASIVETLIKYSNRIIELPFLPHLLQCIFEVLRIELDTPISFNMKLNIISMGRTLLFSYSNPSHVSEVKVPFSLFFRNEFSTFFISTALSVLEKCSNQSLKINILSFISIAIGNRLQEQLFYTDHFLDNIIISSLQLTDDDLRIFDEIPQQFIEFCCCFPPSSFNSGPSSVRQAVFDIIQKMHQEGHDDFLYHTLERAKSPSMNPQQLETKLFIIGCILHHCPSNELLPSLMELLRPGQFPLIIAGTLAALYHFSDDYEILTDCSLFFIQNGVHPVIRLCAASLFEKAFKPDDMQLNTSIDITHIISSLLELTSNYPSQVLGNSLQKIMASNLVNESFIQGGVNLIAHIFQSWEQIANDGEGVDISTAKSLFVVNAQIISKILKEKDLILKISDNIINSCIQILSKYPAEYPDDMFNILCTLISQMDDPPPSVFMTFQPLCQIISTDWLIFKHCVKFFCLLMRKTNFDHDLLSVLIDFCNTAIENCDSVSEVLHILSVAVEIGGETYWEVGRIASNFLSIPNCETNTFCSALVLLSSCLIINENQSISLINDNIIQNLIHFKYEKFNYMQYPSSICITGLLIISKHNFFPAFHSSISLMKAVSIPHHCKLVQEEDSEEEWSDYSESSGFDEEEISSYPMAFFNYIPLVTQILQSTDFFSHLSEDDQRFLHSKLN